MKGAETARAELDRSRDMKPVHGTVDVHVPIDTLWNFFRQASSWPRWNHCFYWVHNRDLVQNQQLIWCFQPIRPWYMYKMPAIAKIVEMDPPNRVTWHVTALPGFFARHSYLLEDLGDGITRFASWEKAMGAGFRVTKKFWIAHFEFVCRESLEGGKRLESVYRQSGRLGSDLFSRHPQEPNE